MYWPAITLDTPIEDLQKIHKDIWDYVIKHHMKPLTPYTNNCVACEYAYRQWKRIPTRSDSSASCSHCPIQWPYGLTCGDDGSLYDKYVRARKTNDLDAIEAIAKEIRDVPWKGDRKKLIYTRVDEGVRLELVFETEYLETESLIRARRLLMDAMQAMDDELFDAVYNTRIEPDV